MSPAAPATASARTSRPPDRSLGTARLVAKQVTGEVDPTEASVCGGAGTNEPVESVVGAFGAGEGLRGYRRRSYGEGVWLNFMA